MVVEPTKLYSQQVPASFKVTMASLGSNKELEDCSSSSSVKSQRTSLIFNLDNKDDFTLCSLTPEKVEQQPLNLVLTEGEIISFRVEGSHSIYLSGNYIINEETDEYDDEEEMFSDEAEEDSQIEYDSEDFDGSDSGSEIENEEKKNPRIRVIESDEDEEDDSEISEEDLDSEDLESEDLDSEDLESESESEEESQKSAKRSIKSDLPETKKSKDTVTPVASPVPAKVSPAAVKVSPAATKVSPVTVSAKVTPPAAEKVAAQVVAKQASPTPEAIKVAAPVKKVLPSGLEIEDLKLGSGTKANQGKAVLIRYKGTLLNGKVFDSNFGGKPLKFVVGKGDVIKGMDIGIVGMAVGGTRKLVIPGPLAYGKQALPGIPRGSTLVFEIRLEKIL